MRIAPGNMKAKRQGASKTPTTAAGDDMLHHLAFDNTVQANIITKANTGKIISANNAACKLLDYSETEILKQRRSTLFDINESRFKKMLAQRTAKGHSVALVTAITKTGKQLPVEITSAVFMDTDGVEKAITTIVDRSQSIRHQKDIDTKKEKIVADNIGLAKSRQKKIDTKKEKIVAEDIVLALAKSDSREAEHTIWLKYIGITSYDVMWNWDITSGQIYVSHSIEEVFGYTAQNNSIDFTDFTQQLLPEEKEAVEEKLSKALVSRSKSWNDSYQLKRHDGSIASTISRASIVRDEEGTAIRLIGTIKDISNLQELEIKLREQISINEDDSEKFLMAARLSFDVIWDWDLSTDKVFIGEGFEELFGYVIKNNIGYMASDWGNHLHPDDRETIDKELHDIIVSSATHWEHAYRVIRADGSLANVFGRASIFRSADGKAYRMIGAIQDLSWQKELEEKLELEIKLREKQISEAMEEAKESERSHLGKELHDNVNQVLAASRMFLELAKLGGANSKNYLNRSSEYTLGAIEEIRKLTKGMTTDIIKNLGLCDAIDNITKDATEASQVKISCILDHSTEHLMNEKCKLNIFRIVQEQLNNILKHAHATDVAIDLSKTEKSIQLTISDNGIGFDTSKNSKGIGIANIKSRAASYDGIADIVSQPDKGCNVTVTIPISDALLNRK